MNFDVGDSPGDWQAMVPGADGADMPLESFQWRDETREGLYPAISASAINVMSS